MSGIQSSQGRIVAVDDEIAFEDAMVVTPADATLVKDLTLRVRLWDQSAGHRAPTARASPAFSECWAASGPSPQARRKTSPLSPVSSLDELQPLESCLASRQLHALARTRLS